MHTVLPAHPRPRTRGTNPDDGKSAAPHPVKRLGLDTSPEVEAVLVEGYRRMSPQRKLQRVAALNRALEELASARIRARYGDALPPREMRLRLAALRLDRDTMRRVFGWDPVERGY